MTEYNGTGTEVKNMIAEIICVGTEILLGNIVNTNAQYLSKRLAEAGVDVHFETVVGDNPHRIMDAVKIAYGRADTVILTGGLGPTKDDLTKEMLAEYFGTKLVMDEKALNQLNEFLQVMKKESLQTAIMKQALVPEGSIVMYNHHGTAPGVIMENEGKVCILLPGPPKEMQPMFEEYCMPFLKERSGRTLVSVNIKMLSMQEAPRICVGEAPVADALGDLVDNPNPTVATYAKEDGCLIRVTAEAETREEALAMLEPMIEKIRLILKDEYIRWIREEE
ncbi:MAG: hypothetical protein IKF51_03955 [Solobacterium sp.]|nr:hypothetical protein [Solobacterium sp.]